MVYSGFAGYKFKDKYSLGLEYNYMQNYSFVKDNNMTGYSVYLTYVVNEKFQLFGRYDALTSNTLTGETDAWNYEEDGDAIIGGIQYKLQRSINLSANLQYWSPKIMGSDKEAFIYVSLEYKL